jgi:hypothetical protein
MSRSSTFKRVQARKILSSRLQYAGNRCCMKAGRPEVWRQSRKHILGRVYSSRQPGDHHEVVGHIDEERECAATRRDAVHFTGTKCSMNRFAWECDAHITLYWRI